VHRSPSPLFARTYLQLFRSIAGRHNIGRAFAASSSRQAVYSCNSHLAPMYLSIYCHTNHRNRCYGNRGATNGGRN